MSHDTNPLLVDYDLRRDESRSGSPERFDWLCSLERPVPRRRTLIRRLAAIVSR